MSLTCSYCGCGLEKGASKCESCGAPTAREIVSHSDFRSCPYCRRKLLALASPSCSYCGKRLPDDYIEAREADLKRIAEVSSGGDDTRVNEKMGELIRQSAGQRGGESLLDILNSGSLTDLLS